MKTDVDARDSDVSAQDFTLQRKLENRHIQLISISGAIGTGLFMGAGKAISLSGTSILWSTPSSVYLFIS